MRYKVLVWITLISVIIISCDGVGISSKLDFGDSPSVSLVRSPPQHRAVYKNKRQETNTDGDFDGIGVVCVSKGCNKTKSNEFKDSIQTDVLVHVQTNVELNKNKTSIIDDTPDIPVIVGTGGTKFESGHSQTINQRPIVISDFDSSPRPSPIAPSSVSSVPSAFYPHHQYNRPSVQSDKVYVTKNVATEPRVDINIKTLPPVTLTMTNDGGDIKDIRYQSNGIEVRVPYFEPSYHNHYFSENPPPQVVWYPKRAGIVDTVDYKPKAAWKPSFWSNGNVQQTHKHVGTGTTCSCNNPPTTGLQWHPSSRRVYGNDPGTQINDKLAPLN